MPVALAFLALALVPDDRRLVPMDGLVGGQTTASSTLPVLVALTVGHTVVVATGRLPGRLPVILAIVALNVVLSVVWVRRRAR